MNIGLELKIAYTYLRSKQKEKFISITTYFSLIGMMLGVATLIIVMSVMKGYEVELIKRIVGINGHVSIEMSKSSFFQNYDSLDEQLKSFPEVSFSAPVIMGQAVAMSPHFSAGVMIRGMKANDLNTKPILQHAFSNRFDLEQGIVLGTTLASTLGAKIGDYVKLIVPEFNSTVIGSIPRMKSYKVVATFDVGMYEYNSTTVFMSMQDALKLAPNSSYSGEILLHSPDQIEEVKKKIIDNIDLGNMIINDWQMANQSFASALKVERTVMMLILSLLIIIAAFNIISGLIMLVNDKSKNIAIMKTIGAPQGMIIRIFIICGLIIGITGTTLGAILGIVFTLNIDTIKQWLEVFTGFSLFDPLVYFLTHLPTNIEASNIIIIISMSLALSLLATIYPAWKAAKLAPIEILRNS